MPYQQLAYVHLATIVPAFFIGTYLMVQAKGTDRHRFLGRIYMLLMLLTAVISLFMTAQVGPKFLNHFGFIHLFSLLVLFLVPKAYLTSRNQDLDKHKRAMFGVYFGGILIAGFFAFMPGRMLHELLFG